MDLLNSIPVVCTATDVAASLDSEAAKYDDECDEGCCGAGVGLSRRKREAN